VVALEWLAEADNKVRSDPTWAGTEIEAADDFILTGTTTITSASFIGLAPIGFTVNDLNLEVYRVFPLDSTNPPDGRVPMRANSPSDVALAERSVSSGISSLTTSVLAPSFTAGNSVLNGIHPSPNQTTGGEGSVSGEEVLFTVLFPSPFVLPADHYFFVPQVRLTSGDFYWLSASRPIPVGLPNTPITPDLQAWIRNDNIDPDWLRIGTDIVGGTTPPTFNMAFELQGDAVPVPEPATLSLLGMGLVGLATRAWRRPTD
jgi:PEP-CTERM motif